MNKPQPAASDPPKRDRRSANVVKLEAAIRREQRVLAAVEQMLREMDGVLDRAKESIRKAVSE